jgi:hypothetical protein
MLAWKASSLDYILFSAPDQMEALEQISQLACLSLSFLIYKMKSLEYLIW